MRRLTDGRPPLHMLHIGKTGGTALVDALLPHASSANHRLVFDGHDVTTAHVPSGEQFMFVVRDPVERFVSAFNSRRAMDHPRYHYPWTPEEQIAFAKFETLNELAAALSSEIAARRDAAERAMRGIGHLKDPYSYRFGDTESFRLRLLDVFLIGLLEQLADDFEVLKAKLGLPAEVRLPTDPVAAHRGPRPATSRPARTAAPTAATSSRSVRRSICLRVPSAAMANTTPSRAATASTIRTPTASASGRGLMCAECGATADSRVYGWRGGWRAYLAFDPAGDDFPYTVLFCSRCAEREFGPLPRAKCRVT